MHYLKEADKNFKSNNLDEISNLLDKCDDLKKYKGGVLYRKGLINIKENKLDEA